MGSTRNISGLRFIFYRVLSRLQIRTREPRKHPSSASVTVRAACSTKVSSPIGGRLVRAYRLGRERLRSAKHTILFEQIP